CCDLPQGLGPAVLAGRNRENAGPEGQSERAPRGNPRSAPWPLAALRLQAARRGEPAYQRRTLAGPSLDHLVRPPQHRGRDREAERLRRLEIYDEMEPIDLLDRQIRGIGA